ncbi:hypothetical protein ACI3KS_04375 [Microbacterium sp. ZW T5_45]|uniref:hypothetical protein n=1 Tax=Microbacterium sp. ZW T5_45 TaxID=3378080 RepID=UPI003852BA8E
METRLVLHGRITIEPGHRVEVAEAIDAVSEGVPAPGGVAVAEGGVMPEHVGAPAGAASEGAASEGAASEGVLSESAVDSPPGGPVSIPFGALGVAVIGADDPGVLSGPHGLASPEPVRSVIAIVDLDTGVRYQATETLRAGRRWAAHVVDCLVLQDGQDTRTVLTVAPVESARTGASDALRDATAAVDAAKAEAARWGGSIRTQIPSHPRVW